MSESTSLNSTRSHPRRRSIATASSSSCAQPSSVAWMAFSRSMLSRSSNRLCSRSAETSARSSISASLSSVTTPDEKVVAEVRKDEQRRLYAQGDKKAAKALKKTKYILCSKRETLQKKDKAASDGKTIVHEGRLFPRNEVKASGGKESRYDELLYYEIISTSEEQSSDTHFP